MTKEIWLFLDSSKPGGIETHVLQLAQGLNSHGIQARVIFLTNHGAHPMGDQLQRWQIPTLTLDGRFSGLLSALRRLRPLILHTHGYKAGLYGRLAARLCGTPVFSTYHAGEIASGRLALYDWLDRISAGLATGVFAVSPQIAARLPVKAMLADNFVDTDAADRSSGRQIAFVGRLSHEKGPDRFLRLAALHPERCFHVYGAGPLAEDLRTQATANVRFHGLQRDMTEVWPRIGLLVMSSRHEGLPMAALEAMARGIPLLASNVGALPELVQQNENGWLEDQEDVQAFSGRIRHWLAMPDGKRRHMGDSARQLVEKRFSAHAAIPNLLVHYRQAGGQITYPESPRSSGDMV